MGSPFLGTLLDEGWGKSWGVLLAGEHPYEQVLAALQRVLIIEIPGVRALCSASTIPVSSHLENKPEAAPSRSRLILAARHRVDRGSAR